VGEMNVETSQLHSQAARFGEAAADQRRAAMLDEMGVEEQIAAFGEINAGLHDAWRSAKAAQARAWVEHGRRHDEHAAKLVTAANGYDGQELAAIDSLTERG
jgi:Excreted virulence factor EspC, type VII ESX diderm